jgi:hypothetical protein
VETTPFEPIVDESGPSSTIDEFCTLEKISRASFFKMQRAGVGPELLRVPNTNIVRVTATARRAWHLRMEDIAQQEAATLERQRRVDHAQRAGRAAAKSEAHHSKRKRS